MVAFCCLSCPKCHDQVQHAARYCLQDCLHAFTEVEELSGDESFECERCKARQLTTKVLRVCRCPPVLVLHLKRFSMHASTLFSSPLEKVLSAHLSAAHACISMCADPYMHTHV